jgi:amino acid adenylation domain-containing protein
LTDQKRMEAAPSIFPASYAQRRLWFLQQLAPESAAYNMVVSVPLPDAVDPPLLQSALDALLARHESLRTSFAVEAEEVVQRIAPQAQLRLQVHRLGERSELGPLLSLSAAEPFDLSTAPLARAHLRCFADGRPMLSLVVHHIIADGQTLRIFLEDLDTAMQALRAGRIVVLPEPPVEYADYSVWQRRTLSGRKLDVLTAYWVRRLEGLPELDLPRDHDRPSTGSTRGGMVPLRIGADTAAGLRSLAAASNTTLFATLLAGFSALLARFSGQSSLAIGIPVSGRTRVEFERVAGLFVNSLVFRADVAPETSFGELVRQTGGQLAADLSHQEMPFELVVDALRVPRRADRNPLFQLMLQLQVQPPRSTAVGPADADQEPSLDSDKLSSQLDLSFILFDHGTGQIDGAAVYAADLFDRASITQLVDAYGALLAEAMRASHRRIDELPLLDPGRRDALLALGQGPERAWPAPQLLHEWFEEQARQAPDRVAVESERGQLSFVALDRRADRVAAALRRAGARPGAIVGVCMPRSLELVIAIVGVLKAGAAYLPLDDQSPRQRLEFILADCRACAVVVPPGRADRALGRPAIEVDGGNDDATGFEARPADAALSPSAPAYVIYTSGSTGEPKGVSIPHTAVVNHMRWMIDRFGFAVGDRVLQRTPPTFDASVWEMWVPLLSGATLVLAPDDGHFDPGALLDHVRDRGITTLQVVPSLLRTLVDRPELAHCGALRRVFCGGEVLPAELQRRFLATLNAELCNLYGPTEATIDATFHPCAPVSGEREVPIGRPIANVVVRVLDERLQPLPCGVAGELFIGGAAVGIGYVGRSTLTAERFIDDPHAPGGRLFRTGDRGRMRHDGTLQFLGRIDDQIKLRGYRIEPGAIEAQLMRHPAVAEAAVVMQEHDAGDKRLVAFVRPTSGASFGLAPELLAWLRGRLPAHEVPTEIGICASLPKTAHGKLDRAALRRTMPEPDARETPWAAPRNAREREICRHFAGALALDRVGIDDDFFRLGGHSLLVVSVCARLSRALGVEVKVVDIFEYPTPRQLSEALLPREPGPVARPASMASVGMTLIQG